MSRTLWFMSRNRRGLCLTRGSGDARGVGERTPNHQGGDDTAQFHEPSTSPCMLFRDMWPMSRNRRRLCLKRPSEVSTSDRTHNDERCTVFTQVLKPSTSRRILFRSTWPISRYCRALCLRRPHQDDGCARGCSMQESCRFGLVPQTTCNTFAGVLKHVVDIEKLSCSLSTVMTALKERRHMEMKGARDTVTQG